MQVVSFGEILWDIHGSTRTLGGAPANVAYHARQLGAASALVSAVGDDPLGRAILDQLDAWHVNRACVATLAGRPTGTVQVHLDAGGQPTYEIVLDVAWDFIPESPRLTEIVPQADAVCFGSLAQRSNVSRKTLQSLLKMVRPDTLRVFDVNLRPTGPDAEVIHDSILACDLLKMNDGEVERVGQAIGITGSEAEVVAKLFDLGVRIVAITRGANGSTVIDRTRTSALPAPKVAVQDTIGAGDAFTATMIVELLRGADAHAAHARAVEVAAFVCMQRGATPALPPEWIGRQGS